MRREEISESSSQTRVVHPTRTEASTLWAGDRADGPIDPDGLRYVATILLWARWFVIAFCLLQLVYRPAGWPLSYAIYVPAFALLFGVNAYSHYWLATRGIITRRWIIALGAMDIVLVSCATVAGGGFDHYFLHLLYYPPLAVYALVFTSFRMTMGLVSLVAIMYLVISLAVGDGVDTAAREEKPLFARIFVMYAVAASVNLFAGFERSRWRAATKREQAHHRERVEFSQAVHDSTAQSAYLIDLGIDAARELAGDSHRPLAERLEAVSHLSKTAIWELRHPIDMGRIFDGRELARTLDSHLVTFTDVTSVQAELVQSGEEPPLSTEARSLLFTIAHNALTNAFRHADAGRVLVDLEFGPDELRLSVSDDGAGLPDDYEARGHGFANMRTDAGRLGGRLVVHSSGLLGGVTVVCVMPLA